MTRYGQIGWRMAAVAAFFGTAALAIALSRAPADNGISLSSELSGQVCSTSGLEAWLGLGGAGAASPGAASPGTASPPGADRKSTRLKSSHRYISDCGFCLQKKKNESQQ